MYPKIEQLGIPVRWGYVTQFEMEQAVMRHLEVNLKAFFDTYDSVPGHSMLPFVEKAEVIEKVLERLSDETK